MFANKMMRAAGSCGDYRLRLRMEGIDRQGSSPNPWCLASSPFRRKRGGPISVYSARIRIAWTMNLSGAGPI